MKIWYTVWVSEEHPIHGSFPVVRLYREESEANKAAAEFIIETINEYLQEGEHGETTLAMHDFSKEDFEEMKKDFESQDYEVVLDVGNFIDVGVGSQEL